MYGVINSLTKKIKKVYGSIESTTKEVKKIYGVVNGVTKLIYSSEVEVSLPFYFLKDVNSSNMEDFLFNGATLFPHAEDFSTGDCFYCYQALEYNVCIRETASYWKTYLINNVYYIGGDSTIHNLSYGSSTPMCNINYNNDIVSDSRLYLILPKINGGWDYLVGHTIRAVVYRATTSTTYFKGLYLSSYEVNIVNCTATIERNNGGNGIVDMTISAVSGTDENPVMVLFSPNESLVVRGCYLY